jgi:hypothetical protein
MDEMQRFAALADQLAQEDVEVPELPFHARNTLAWSSRPYYLCSPGCGKPFTDIASKRAHQAWCTKVKQ